jgi:Heparinase II/III N-terminus
VLPRFVASWLGRKPARAAAPPRSGLGVPVPFAPRRSSGLEIPIDWNVEDSDLHAMEFLAGLGDTEVVSLVDGWIAEGKGADDSRARAIRCAIWMQQISARTLPRDFVVRASRSIADQVREVEDGASDIANARALLFAGRYFAGSEAERWRKIGIARLEWAIGVSVLDDGVHVERASDAHLWAFARLLECRAVVDDEPLRSRLRRRLDRMAQAAADLAAPGTAEECLRVHTALGGEAAYPRPAFAFESAGRFGLRGDESSLVVHDDRTFAWSLGGLPFVLPTESFRGRVLDLRAVEDSLEIRLARDGGAWTLRASTDRIDVEDEVLERTEGPVRTRLRLHPAVEFELSSDARRLELRRKGIRAIVDGPSPMRVVRSEEGVEIVVHHGIAPCTGELSLRHVPATFGRGALDSLPGLARRRIATAPVGMPAEIV